MLIDVLWVEGAVIVDGFKKVFESRSYLVRDPSQPRRIICTVTRPLANQNENPTQISYSLPDLREGGELSLELDSMNVYRSIQGSLQSTLHSLKLNPVFEPVLLKDSACPHLRQPARQTEDDNGGDSGTQQDGSCRLKNRALLKFMWVRNWLKGLQEAQ